jgi:hypothetical protein
MSTLCLSDMGELRDEWLREPRPAPLPAPTVVALDPPAAPTPGQVAYQPDDEAVAA